MFLYLLLAAAALVIATSLVLPTWRRMWVFHLTAARYVILWIGGRLGLRRLWFALCRRRYNELTAPRAMRLFCEDMGPTFIKFGQIVASSAGMFPERYTVEFRKCLDRVRPFPFAQVVDIIENSMGADRAAQLVDIDPQPLASASIAQVHTARLHDGTEVVIKVQRPGIEERIAADMRIMHAIARIAAGLFRDAELANPVAIVDDFAVTLGEELDFRKEAQNLDHFNEIMAELGHNNIRAPVPQWQHTSRQVLVMERFFGTRVDNAEEIQARGVNAEAALVSGMRAWFQCVVHYGFFHGDVHAGNLMLLDDGDIGFLDFGIVGRFTDRERWLVIDYLIAFASGNYHKLAEVITEMGGVPDNLDMDSFVADLKKTYSPLLSLSFGEINYADFLPEIHRTAAKHRMVMPKEFVLITKQMLYFDRYAKLLAPSLNVFTDPRLIVSLMADVQKARAAMNSAPGE
ncbi:MAG: AarF/UbiB family protein [Proteobacteria bacterium]|nr:AarF/UbiB family protein [Pseudomonadota bacterium]